MKGIIFCALLLILLLSAVIEAQPVGQSADMLVQRGHYKLARVILEKRIAANSKDVESLVLLAPINLAYDKTEEAKKLLQQAVALQSGSVEAHLALAEALDVMARFYTRAPTVVGGSSSRASEITHKIASLDAARGDLASGQIALHNNEGEKTEALYLKAIGADPKPYQALMQLVSLYMNTKWKNFDKAEKWAVKAEQLENDRVTPNVVLAPIYSSRAQWAELEQMLANAEKYISDSYLPHNIAGRTPPASGNDNARAERHLCAYLAQQEGEAPVLAGADWRLDQVLERKGKCQRRCMNWKSLCDSSRI